MTRPENTEALEPRLVVEGLSGGYGPRDVVRDVSFLADRGQLVGILGPNGAGKSTLGRLLCGQLRPSSGSILIDGHRLPAQRERRHLIGVVPQNIGLYPHLTGRENLEAFARLLRVPGMERPAAVARALELVDMDARADIRVDHMSGGMQRRINTAVATLTSPPVIFFDEPTAGVDHPSRDTIHMLAKRLSGEGHVVCLVTHELEQAEQICDRVLVLSSGALFDYGSPAAVLEKAFGDKHEIILRLRHAPSLLVHDKLCSLGFNHDAARHTAYVASATDGSPSFIARLMSSLGDARDKVREVTVRKPGLDALMAQLAAS